ncbi:MAG TPA: fibronectin type III-like domain-contianing protein, partial [Pyrinomonadaceae bacterium]
LAQLPPMMDYDIRRGRTYMYLNESPLYPFGYGLSYTTFVYRNLMTSSSSLSVDGQMDINVVVKNAGNRAGEEVVQLYVTHLNSKVSRPIRELKGFARIHLNPQEEATVKLNLPASRLAYWNVESRRWVVEKDQIEIAVGASSKDLRLRKTIRVQ